MPATTPSGQAEFNIHQPEESMKAAQEKAQLRCSRNTEFLTGEWAYRLHEVMEIDISFYSPGEKPISIRISAYPIIRRTRCGFWIWDWFNSKKTFILEKSGRPWASPTPKIFIKDFRRRKEAQFMIAKRAFRRAEMALAMLGGVDRIKLASPTDYVEYVRDASPY